MKLIPIVVRVPKPEVVRRGALYMQLCVPKNWTDRQIQGFADHEDVWEVGGWKVRKEGNAAAAGDLERVPCGDHPGFVHVIVEC